jgi:hypothetical protein
VKWIYERYLCYCENPPPELIEAALERARESGAPVDHLRAEEARALVSGSQIQEYMARELSIKELYYQALSETELAVPFEDVLGLPMEEVPKAGLERMMIRLTGQPLGGRHAAPKEHAWIVSTSYTPRRSSNRKPAAKNRTANERRPGKWTYPSRHPVRSGVTAADLMRAIR